MMLICVHAVFGVSLPLVVVLRPDLFLHTSSLPSMPDKKILQKEQGSYPQAR